MRSTFTIFSNGSIIPPGLKFAELHALALAGSYALLLRPVATNFLLISVLPHNIKHVLIITNHLPNSDIVILIAYLAKVCMRLWQQLNEFPVN